MNVLFSLFFLCSIFVSLSQSRCDAGKNSGRVNKSICLTPLKLYCSLAFTRNVKSLHWLTTLELSIFKILIV